MTMGIDFKKIKTYPLSQRKNKVSIHDFSRPDFLANDLEKALPEILMSKDLKSVVKDIIAARKNNKEVIMMIGAHVIKTGLSPILIELMRKKVITHLAMNGACCIHDFEIALIGETSEDVAENLENGKFGMWEETGRHMNEAIIEGAAKGLGYADAITAKIESMSMKHMEYSVLHNAKKYGARITAHPAIGTEIIHQHPKCDGAAIGKTSYQDFKQLADSISKLEGGVIINMGSSVIMPEIFLKALTIVRNLGFTVDKFTAANFDFINHYRPRENVVMRPTMKGGKGYTIIGAHEIMLPLLASMVFRGMQQ
ncbi:hypothetical protein HYV81_03320 [Candidatus Woesearchaeota archaeon]|nr:hypothetical protein [Candidatus Woesearchaeota archaeon]